MRYEIVTLEDGTRWIDKDQLFPIYGITAKWKQDEYKREGNDWKPTGNRVDNSLYNTRIFREPLSEKEIQKLRDSVESEYLGEVGEKMRKSRNRAPLRNWSDLEVEVELKYWESWHLTRFTHETFRDDRTREEVIQSFENYVSRHEWYQDHFLHSERLEELVATGQIPVKVCLMGAEDRWRWRGKDDESEYPCNCDKCKEAGMWRISH